MGKRKAFDGLNTEQGDGDAEESDSASKRAREELCDEPHDERRNKSVPSPTSEEKENKGSSGKRRRDLLDPHPEGDGDAVEGEGSNKRTRIRLSGDYAQLKMLGPLQLPDFVKEPVVGADFATEIRKLKLRLVLINRKLKGSGILDDLVEEDGSLSISPVYDHFGTQMNSRETMFHEKLIQERQRIISRLIWMNPTFKSPPSDEPRKFSKKLYIPLKEYPRHNFIGLIIGPRGNTQKRMENETGARIRIRGKGLLKEGRHHHMQDMKPDPSERDDLHVLVEAENKASLDAAVGMVEKLLVPVDEGIYEHKATQFKELAELNVMCNVCGELGTKQHIFPCRSSTSSGTTDCPLMTTVPGSKRDQHHRFDGGRPTFGASPVPSNVPWWANPASGISPFYSPYPYFGHGLTTALESKTDKENDNSNLYVGYLPLSVDNGRLIELFSPFGRLLSAKVVRDKKTGLSKGIGFVKYANPLDAAKAVVYMNGRKIYGKKLVVRVAGRSSVTPQKLHLARNTGIGHPMTHLGPKFSHLENPEKPDPPVQMRSYPAFTKSCTFQVSHSPVYLVQNRPFSRELITSYGSRSHMSTPTFQYQPCYGTSRSGLSSQFHLTPLCSQTKDSCLGSRSPSWAR